jgi:hypothetical protein
MKTSTVYVLENLIIIHPLSKSKAGFLLADEPFIILGTDTPKEKIIESINECLNKSKTNVANPTDWGEFDKQLLKNMGQKSWKEIKKKQTKNCYVQLDNGVITFIPTKHDEAAKGAGFFHKKNDATTVKLSAGEKDIQAAFELALSKCE